MIVVFTPALSAFGVAIFGLYLNLLLPKLHWDDENRGGEAKFGFLAGACSAASSWFSLPLYPLPFAAAVCGHGRPDGDDLGRFTGCSSIGLFPLFSGQRRCAALHSLDQLDGGFYMVKHRSLLQPQLRVKNIREIPFGRPLGKGVAWIIIRSG